MLLHIIVTLHITLRKDDIEMMDFFYFGKNSKLPSNCKKYVHSIVVGKKHLANYLLLIICFFLIV